MTMPKEIVRDLREYFGLECLEVAPVAGGWLNRKWKAVTDRGDWLVKQYSRERYSEAGLAQIEWALKRQMILAERGLPCPRLLRCGEEIVRHLPGNVDYMAMEFRPGRVETFATVTLPQLRGLGETCARMHEELARLSPKGARGFPLDGGQVYAALWENYRARRREMRADAPDEYREAVRALEPVLRDLPEDFLIRMPKGLGHEDFSNDNLLFSAEGLSAIVDFDRLQYGFALHDAGRALLSFAWREGELDMAKARAFADGYARCAPLAIADALRVAWCVETPWWIRPEFFAGAEGKTARFKDEMVWLTRRWFDLEEILREGT